MLQHWLIDRRKIGRERLPIREDVAVECIEVVGLKHIESHALAIKYSKVGKWLGLCALLKRGGYSGHFWRCPLFLCVLSDSLILGYFALSVNRQNKVFCDRLGKSLGDRLKLFAIRKHDFVSAVARGVLTILCLEH